MLPNRQLGTIERITDEGDLAIRTDSGRNVQFNIREHPHLDYGYAVTSHSSQGQTDRALIHVDTAQGERLVNARMAYVSVSRGRYDAEIYTTTEGSLHAISAAMYRNERPPTSRSQQSEARDTNRKHHSRI